ADAPRPSRLSRRSRPRRSFVQVGATWSALGPACYCVCVRYESSGCPSGGASALAAFAFFAFVALALVLFLFAGIALLSIASRSDAFGSAAIPHLGRNICKPGTALLLSSR